MTPTHRPRQLVTAAFAAVLVLALAACSQEYPNSTFNHYTEFNRSIDSLWNKLLFWGTLVFVLVEAVLIWTIIKYRRREGNAEPKHVHGNTTLEIIWTAIPAVILVFIAVPTVQTIFRTQAKAVPDALQVEVIGHQWWWEFRYPEYGIVTANELYLPIGRTVNFSLQTQDVLHSFWIPQMGGKRDLISNHTNYLWFTPDSVTESSVWNGFCAEYCGASHANMKFRAFTVTPEEFASWVALQQQPVALGATVPAASAASAASTDTAPGAPADSASTGAAAPASPGAPTGTPATPATAVLASQAGYTFPREQMPAWAIPTGKTPRGLEIDAAVLAAGSAEEGQQLVMSGIGGCVGCHAFGGTPFNMANIGPNLTHFGSRTTLAAGMYPNDARHLALWIKNARAMKPGSLMPAIGVGQYDPILKTQVKAGLAGLTDEQIADVVAYLLALK